MVRHRVLVSTFLGSNPSGPVLNFSSVKGQKIFLFDFDGVVVNGMREYWHSSLLACEKFLNSPNILINKILYQKVSNTFREIRPWVKYGLEMVLITHEIIRTENQLNKNNQKDFTSKYQENCQKILRDNSWLDIDLQKFLDESRKYQIDKDFDKWVNLHDPFYEVLEFIDKLREEKIKVGIITTKGEIFATKFLAKLNIYPELIYGYESGTKVEIAGKLSQKYQIMGFIEYRRKTLEDIKKNTKTQNIPCYLADWGYLKNSDRKNLPKEIRLLKLEDIQKELAI